LQSTYVAREVATSQVVSFHLGSQLIGGKKIQNKKKVITFVKIFKFFLQFAKSSPIRLFKTIQNTNLNYFILATIQAYGSITTLNCQFNGDNA
jgi:hypothetical protein